MKKQNRGVAILIEGVRKVEDQWWERIKREESERGKQNKERESENFFFFGFILALHDFYLF